MPRPSTRAMRLQVQVRRGRARWPRRGTRIWAINASVASQANTASKPTGGSRAVRSIGKIPPMLTWYHGRKRRSMTRRAPAARTSLSPVVAWACSTLRSPAHSRW